MYKKLLVGLGIFVVLQILMVGSTFAAYYTSTNVPSDYLNIGTVEDMIVLPDGNVWYVDSNNSRIVKIAPTGEILRTVGRVGTDDGEFESTVTSITRDANGNLYVLDFYKIYKLDHNGGFIKSWGTIGNGGGAEFSNASSIHYSQHGDMLLVADNQNNRVAKFDTDGNFISDFGTLGAGNNQFNQPQFLTTDQDGNIYVSDTNNTRIQKFTENGVYILSITDSLVASKDVEILSNGDIIVASLGTDSINRYDVAGNLIGSWATPLPHYIAKGADDSLWIAGFNQKNLLHYSDNGSLLHTIANGGESDGHFYRPSGVDFDEVGNMYVLDATGRVQKFDSNGTYLSTIVASGLVGGSAYDIVVQPGTGNILVSSEFSIAAFTPSGTFIVNIGSGGAGDGQFNMARGMDFDSVGFLYVVDWSNGNLQKFDLTNLSEPGFDGGFVGRWAVMNNAERIFIDSNDNLYISSSESPDTIVLDIVKYNTSGVSQGTYLSAWGAGADQYYMVGGIYVDDSGKIYVSDKWLNKIQVYDASGTFLSAESFGSAGSGTEQFNEASYGRFNPLTGDIVVVDTANHRLQIFENGVKIKNLINSADVINTSNSISLVTKSINPASPNVDNLSAHLYFGDYLVSDFNVDLSSDRDWALVNAISLPDQSKSLIVNLNPTDAPGVSSTHSLYVTKRQGQTYVVVCPLATSIADLTLACVDGYTLNQGDAGLTVVTVDGQEYWKIEGLTGTGGLSPVINAYDLTPSATSVSVGTQINVEVVATDNVGLVDIDYVGTVHFSSSPASSSLPNDYTFVTGDAGSHTFGSISFNNPGTYILSATDTVDSARTQSIEITVTANSSNDNNGGNSNSSSSSSSNSSSNSGSCGSDVPSSVPDLFQINASDTTATLYFTPIANASTFNFSYATTPNAEQYGASATLAREGVQHFTISLLKPNTTYYFKVGGQNGCRSGEYSNIMRIVTQRKGVTRQAIYYKNQSKVGQISSNKFAVITQPKSIINEVVTNKIEPVSTPEVKVQKPTAPEKKCYLWGLWCR